VAKAKNSFSMDRHVEALERIEMLESIVRRVPSYAAMKVRYARGEKSWANSINEIEYDIETAAPGVFAKALSEQ
jgi:hypothetical protein